MNIFSQPTYVKFAIALVAASVLLMIVPFVSVRVPIFTFLIINQVLFFATIYTAYLRPFRWKVFVEKPERKKVAAVTIALVVWTICSWIALLNTSSMIMPDDLEQRRAGAVEQNK